MKKLPTFLALLCVFSIKAFSFNDKHSVPAPVKSVTVFRSGAEMIHTAQALLKQGSSELIIEGISNSIDINSLQVNCPSVVTILGVEFSNQYLVPENNTPALKKILDSLELMNHEIEKINISIATTEDLLLVLKSNKEIKGSQTGLSVAELIKLMDYYKLKSAELQKELSAFKTKKLQQQTLIQKLSAQMQEEQKKNTRSAGRVILQLHTALAGDHEFTISYI
ncbi:MAG: DUF4140 domain-containing protein, partial [Ferruginibacter sp.]